MYVYNIIEDKIVTLIGSIRTTFMEKRVVGLNTHGRVITSMKLLYDVITYPYAYFNSDLVKAHEVRVWTGNYVQRKTIVMITYPCLNLRCTLLVKGASEYYSWESIFPIIHRMRLSTDVWPRWSTIEWLQIGLFISMLHLTFFAQNPKLYDIKS